MQEMATLKKQRSQDDSKGRPQDGSWQGAWRAASPDYSPELKDPLRVSLKKTVLRSHGKEGNGQSES